MSPACNTESCLTVGVSEARTGDADGDLADAVAAFAAVRPRIFGVAYRMLGSVAEAEDILQEVWLRWQKCDRRAVRDPAAFLITATTRLSINERQSARARRETYIGPWLPDPVDTGADPTLGAERAEALEFATLMLMERLTPAERAAYVLREAFDYPYGLIAETIETSQANARQLVSRARRHLAEARRHDVDPAEQRQLLTAFVAAAQNGDMATLESLFAEDIVSYTDGNGIRNAARHPVVGRETVARFVCAFRRRVFADAVLTWVTVNSAPAVVISHGGGPFHDGGVFETFVALTPSERGITQLLWHRLEGKVSHLG
ncbi:RNA polymerase sigma factor SigJ [Mycolicibacterium austroafricanum]|nr:RNA polymerase subunit sigma-24 [Mycolicibacterium austroafricanum]QRZ06089.1 RNA polymerase sigma factor SigJ [Mycolicibacterium austroafricanum]QZT67574.1 RNA polymerase sigma factor SigJ [Mycolicibacterium austroafricanum]